MLVIPALRRLRTELVILRTSKKQAILLNFKTGNQNSGLFLPLPITIWNFADAAPWCLFLIRTQPHLRDQVMMTGVTRGAQRYEAVCPGDPSGMLDPGMLLTFTNTSVQEPGKIHDCVTNCFRGGCAQKPRVTNWCLGGPVSSC